MVRAWRHTALKNGDQHSDVNLLCARKRFSSDIPEVQKTRAYIFFFVCVSVLTRGRVCVIYIFL